MATTQAELDLAFLEVGTEVKKIYTKLGDLTGLSTTSKVSLVEAINSLVTAIGDGLSINDTTPSTTSVYSSTKVDSAIAIARSGVKAEILGGAAAAYDTLQELVTYFNGLDTANDSDVASLVTAIANRLRFDTAQTLTAPQKVQANANLGSLSLVDFGDPAHSYKNVFLAALA